MPKKKSKNNKEKNDDDHLLTKAVRNYQPIQKEKKLEKNLLNKYKKKQPKNNNPHNFNHHTQKNQSHNQQYSKRFVNNPLQFLFNKKQSDNQQENKKESQSTQKLIDELCGKEQNQQENFGNFVTQVLSEKNRLIQDEKNKNIQQNVSQDDRIKQEEPTNDEINLQIKQRSNDQKRIQLEKVRNQQKLTPIKTQITLAQILVKKQLNEKQSIQKMQNQIQDIISQLQSELMDSVNENKNHTQNFINNQSDEPELKLKQKQKQKQRQMQKEEERQRQKQRQKEALRLRQNQKEKQKLRQKEVEYERTKQILRDKNSTMLIFQNELKQKLNRSQERQSIECQSISQQRQKPVVVQELSDKHIRRIYIPKMQIIQKNTSKNLIRFDDSSFVNQLRKITDKKQKRSGNYDKKPVKKYQKKKYLIQISIFNESIDVSSLQTHIQDEKQDSKYANKTQQKECLYKINYYLPHSYDGLQKRYTLLKNSRQISGLKLVKTQFMLKSKLLKLHPKQFVQYLESSLFKTRKKKQGGLKDPIIIEAKIPLQQSTKSVSKKEIQTSHGKGSTRRLRSSSKNENAFSSKQLSKQEIEY